MTEPETRPTTRQQVIDDVAEATCVLAVTIDATGAIRGYLSGQATVHQLVECVAAARSTVEHAIWRNGRDCECGR